MTICPAQNPQGMTWDSSGLVFGQPGGVYRCPATGGQPEQLAKVEVNERVYGPQILPSGNAVLFTISKVDDAAERWDRGTIVVQSLETGTRKTIVEGGSDGRYLPSGHLVYAISGVLYARPFDPGRQEVTGGPVAVVEGVRRAAGAQTGAAQLHISNNGTLLYVPGPSASLTTDRAIAIADRAGTITRLTLPPKPYEHVRASRDGNRIVLYSNDGKEAVVWVHELAGTSAPTRLTFAGRNRHPILSPDGQRVAFQSDREGDQAIFMQRADGTGQVERLTKPEKDESHVPESWSPDGKHISFSVNKSSAFFLRTLSVEDRKQEPFRNVQSIEPLGSVFSPDGRWIAYHSREKASIDVSAGSGVYVEPFPATGAQYQAPKINIDFQPVWAPDGRELIFVPSAASGRLAIVSLSTRTGVIFGTPQTIPAAVTLGRTSGLTRTFDVLPDGRFIGLVAGAETGESRAADSQEIRVVLNWFDQLKRLVPTSR